MDFTLKVKVNFIVPSGKIQMIKVRKDIKTVHETDPYKISKYPSALPDPYTVLKPQNPPALTHSHTHTHRKGNYRQPLSV